MISERQLAQSHSSMWGRVLPLEHHAVRIMNALATVVDVPLEDQILPSRRGLVNEIGFRHFRDCMNRREFSDVVSEDICEKCYAYIAALDHAVTLPLDSAEKAGAMQYSWRLWRHFASRSSPVVVSPTFKGCGLVGPCEGDVLHGGNLIEIKGVNRDFSNLDLRQVLVYAALNHSSAEHSVSSLCLLNPRRGVEATMTLREVAAHASGLTAPEMLSAIVLYITEHA